MDEHVIEKYKSKRSGNFVVSRVPCILYIIHRLDVTLLIIGRKKKNSIKILTPLIPIKVKVKSTFN
jgi:hypothetical protein